MCLLSESPSSKREPPVGFPFRSMKDVFMKKPTTRKAITIAAMSKVVMPELCPDAPAAFRSVNFWSKETCCNACGLASVIVMSGADFGFTSCCFCGAASPGTRSGAFDASVSRASAGAAIGTCTFSWPVSGSRIEAFCVFTFAMTLCVATTASRQLSSSSGRWSAKHGKMPRSRTLHNLSIDELHRKGTDFPTSLRHSADVFSTC
mmetsp:Transcript_33579/g.84855  ORF Transcript_33579/g.84855 Transcript_33579/m.84855 type:complete len:205 (-) Transcript_33579:554-1168(-)